jgi:hypothetical protein
VVVAIDRVHTGRVKTRRWCQLIAVLLYGFLYWYQWVRVDQVKQGDGLQYLGVFLQTFPGLPVGLLLRDRVHLFGTAGALNTAAAITVLLALTAWEVMARRAARHRRTTTTPVGPS